MASSPAADWLPARYQLESLLGTGGMGEVWLARDLEKAHPIAIKRLKLAGSEGGVADRLRFKREFLMLSKLQSPAIVAAYEQGESGSDLYYTMEHVEGWPLKRYFSDGHWRESGADATQPAYFTQREALARLWTIGGEILEALAALHGQALIHRDLKPGNVMVTAAGRVKLIDFGLAREQAADFGITQAGEVLGTPHYLAPEQIRAQPLDGRVDLYALGVMLYELAAGRLPFDGAGIAEILLAHLQRAPPPPREINPHIPPAVSALILRLLAKDPGGRFPTAREALRALREAAGGDTAQHEMTRQLASDATGALPASGLLVAPYIGNAGARDELLRGCRELLGGEGGALLIAGPSGAGKSRLRDEARAYAAGNGLHILHGSGRTGGAAAGQLFDELIAQFAAELQRRPERAAQWNPEAAAVLRARFPALRRVAAFAQLPPPPELSPEAEKGRLFGAFYEIFALQAAQAPVLLWFDDLQWADPLSLDLLTHLLHSFTRGAQSGAPQLFIAGNYRDTELQTGDGLGKWLANMQAASLRKISLRPLDEAELARLAQALLGLSAPPPENFVRRLHELTGGNPYFATETLKGLVADGKLRPDALEGWNFSAWAADAVRSGQISLPESVQEVLAQRLHQVDAAAREALQAAAVIGRKFQFGWWLRVTGLHEDALLQVAESALRAGLLLDGGREVLLFSHDQLRAALLAGLSSLRLRRLHGKIVAAIAADGTPEAHLELLADHAVEAGLPEEAVRYGHPAVKNLFKADQCGVALSLLERIGGLFTEAAPMAIDSRIEHDRLQGSLLNKLGESKAGLAFYPGAIARAAGAGASDVEMELLLYKANGHYRSGDYAGSAQAFGRALTLAEAVNSRMRKAGATYGLAMVMIARGELAGARELLEKLTGEQPDYDDTYRGNALNGLGILCGIAGDLDAAADYFRRSAEAWAAQGNSSSAVLASGNLAETSFLLGRLDEAETELERARRHNQAMGGGTFLCDNLNNLGQCLLQRGRYDEAEGRLRESLRLAARIGERELEVDGRIHLARVLARMGRAAEAAAEIAATSEHAQAMANHPRLARTLAAGAEIALGAGDLAQAAALAEQTCLLAAGKFKESEALALAVRACAAALGGGLHDPADFARAHRLAEETRSFELGLLVDLHHAQALLAAGQTIEAAKLLTPARDRAKAAGFVMLSAEAEKMLTAAR